MTDERGSRVPSAAVTARHLVVLGRVQGVNFRASLQHLAGARGVRGWVANRPEGSVEAWLEGRPDDVGSVEAWVSAGGPPAAEVLELRSREVDPVGCDGFHVRG